MDANMASKTRYMGVFWDSKCKMSMQKVRQTPEIGGEQSFFRIFLFLESFVFTKHKGFQVEV